MHWGLVPFGLSTLVSAFCAFLVWDRRDRPGAKPFTALLVAESIWSAGYVGELASSSLADKLFWDDVQYLVLIVLTPALLAFAWDYREAWPARARLWLALQTALPLATVASILFDPRARTSAHIVPAPPFGALIYAFTPLEWLLAGQLYATVLAVGWLLLRHALAQHAHHRLQAAIIGFGLVAPMLTSVLTLLGVRSILGQRDIAPASFGVAAALVTWALLRGRFFDVAPVARHLVFESLPDPVIVLDPADRVIDLNPGAQALIGPDRVGQPLGAILGESTAQALRSRVELEIAGKTFEARSESMGDHGRVVLMRDVSERKAAAQQLERAHEALEARVSERTRALHDANRALIDQVAERTRAEERFRSLFDHAIELMGIVHPDGRLLAANRTALDFAGVQKADVEGIAIWDGPWWRHSAELRARLREAVKRAAGGELVSMEVSHVDRTGALRDIAFSLKPFASDAVGGLVLLAGGRDITELKRAEQERSELREALYQAQRMESIGRLAGGIAHDFNNLLTVILGQTELAGVLYEAGRDPRPNLAEVMQAGTSAAGLTRQLLAFARKQPTAPRVLSVNRVIRQTSAVLKRLLGEDVQLRLRLSPALANVSIDPGQLEQVLLNLAVNARDAMPNGGVLTIRTEDVDHPAGALKSRGVQSEQTDYVAVYVSDTGSGMSEEVKARLFEPFFTTKEQGSGTGIGLATVHGIVQQAGGFIEVRSRIGEGSTFEVQLPASHAPLSEGPELQEQAPHGFERVALVEDQAQLRELVTDQLSRLGYHVTAFARAEDALHALDGPSAKLDLLVTDVVLSGMSGPTLATSLRKQRSDLKVLYVSGYTDGALNARGLDESVERLLHKPFTLRDLAQAVRAVLENDA